MGNENGRLVGKEITMNKADYAVVVMFVSRWFFVVGGDGEQMVFTTEAKAIRAMNDFKAANLRDKNGKDKYVAVRIARLGKESA